MTLSAVWIELPEAPEAGALHAALVESCNAALAAPICRAARQVEPREDAAVAVVVWEDGRLRVEVGRAVDGRPRWVSRLVEFSARDAESERWRTAGLVIATIVAAEYGEEIAPAPVAAARPALPPPRPEPHAPPPVRRTPSPRGEFGVAPLVALEWQPELGVAGAGVALEVTWLPVGSGVLVAARGEWMTISVPSAGASDARVGVTAAHFSAGYRVVLRPVAFESALGVSVQRLTLTGRDGTVRARDSRDVPGADLGVGLGWPLRGRVLCVEPLLKALLELSPETELRVAGREVGPLGEWEPRLLFGLRGTFP